MRKRTLTAALLMLLPAIAHAGQVSRIALALDEGNASAMLEATSQRYVDAMQRIVQTRWQEAYTARRWETLEAAMADTPVARLEYRVSAGGSPVRLYHGMGGPPLGTVAKEALGGPTPPPSPTSLSIDDPWDSAADPEAVSASRASYQAQDAEDAGMYAPDDGLHVRARMRAVDGSVLHPYEIDGSDRALDAEFKVLAELEHDLRSGAIPRGGSAALLISTETCNSCDYAFRAISRHYGIDLHVTRIVSSIPPAERTRLIAEGRARMRGTRLVDAASGRPLLATDALASGRESQVRQALSPSAMNRRFRHVTWEPRTFRLATPAETRSQGAGEDNRQGPDC